MSGKDSTTTMAAAAAAAAAEKSVTKVFSMFHLDDGLIILEDGKRMPSEISANESITEEIKRLELENKGLDDMIRSLQVTIAEVSADLEAKLEKHQELFSRQWEHPEEVKLRAVFARHKQMQLDKIKHKQELTRLKAECDGSEGGSKRKRIAKRDLSKKCPWK